MFVCVEYVDVIHTNTHTHTHTHTHTPALDGDIVNFEKHIISANLSAMMRGAPEVCASVKRDLLLRQKRPMS